MGSHEQVEIDIHLRVHGPSVLFRSLFAHSPAALNAMMPSSTVAFAGKPVNIHEREKESADSCPGRSASLPILLYAEKMLGCSGFFYADYYIGTSSMPSHPFFRSLGCTIYLRVSIPHLSKNPDLLFFIECRWNILTTGPDP